MKQAYRRWVCGLLACILALLAVCGAVVYVVDPCLYYRRAGQVAAGAVQ